MLTNFLFLEANCANFLDIIYCDYIDYSLFKFHCLSVIFFFLELFVCYIQTFVIISLVSIYNDNLF
jgi:hypothetical protein